MVALLALLPVKILQKLKNSVSCIVRSVPLFVVFSHKQQLGRCVCTLSDCTILVPSCLSQLVSFTLFVHCLHSVICCARSHLLPQMAGTFFWHSASFSRSLFLVYHVPVPFSLLQPHSRMMACVSNSMTLCCFCLLYSLCLPLW